jgi:uncharacterized protein YjaG (DUF416 family)
MSLWDEEVAIHAERIKKLPRPKLLLFMVACLDHAFTANSSSFLRAVDPAQLRIARATLDRLWSCTEHSDTPFPFDGILESLYSVMPGDDDPEAMISGWYYTIAALTSIIRGMIGNSLSQESMTAVDAAYQSVCEDELKEAMLRDGAGLCGEEITEAERASPICRAEIGFQLQCLKAIEEGKPIERNNSDEQTTGQ